MCSEVTEHVAQSGCLSGTPVEYTAQQDPVRQDLSQNRRVTAVTLDLGSGNRLYYSEWVRLCRLPAPA